MFIVGDDMRSQQSEVKQFACDLESLSDVMRNLAWNLERITESIKTLSERTKALERSDEDRRIKKLVIQTLFWLYPIVMFLLVAMVNIDHSNIVTALDAIQGVLQLEG